MAAPANGGYQNWWYAQREPMLVPVSLSGTAQQRRLVEHYTIYQMVYANWDGTDHTQAYFSGHEDAAHFLIPDRGYIYAIQISFDGFDGGSGHELYGHVGCRAQLTNWNTPVFEIQKSLNIAAAALKTHSFSDYNQWSGLYIPVNDDDFVYPALYAHFMDDSDHNLVQIFGWVKWHIIKED